MRTALLLSLLIATPPVMAVSTSASAPANANPPAVESSDKKSGEISQADETTPPDNKTQPGDSVQPEERAQPDEKSKADEKNNKKPSLSLRASPPISFSPAQIHLVAELRGGPDDYEEFYCPAVEWDWGDGTRSESSSDCDPYEAGVSQISRRFSKTHVYNLQGRYRVQIRLKRNTKVLTSASTNIQVRPGIRDMGPYDGDSVDQGPAVGTPTGGRRRP